MFGNWAAGARKGVLHLWAGQMRDALGSDTEGSGPLDLINGAYAPHKKQEFLNLVQ
jgi:hypothetical protein